MSQLKAKQKIPLRDMFFTETKLRWQYNKSKHENGRCMVAFCVGHIWPMTYWVSC